MEKRHLTEWKGHEKGRVNAISRTHIKASKPWYLGRFPSGNQSSDLCGKLSTFRFQHYTMARMIKVSFAFLRCVQPGKVWHSHSEPGKSRRLCLCFLVINPYLSNMSRQSFYSWLCIGKQNHFCHVYWKHLVTTAFLQHMEKETHNCVEPGSSFTNL